MRWIDPWSNKEALKWFLSKFIERDELDLLIQDYLSGILHHKIVCRPSRGRYGEQGKDIVACEDERTQGYCSYLIKKGHLKDNLDGKSGIFKQLSDALFVELESREYWGKPRTAVVVHNGHEGTRAAFAKYEKYRQALEDILVGDKLLRPVERWDLDILTEKLFPHSDRFKEMEASRQIMERQSEVFNVAIEFRDKARTYLAERKENPGVSHSLIKDYHDTFESLDYKYSPSLRRRLREN